MLVKRSATTIIFTSLSLSQIRHFIADHCALLSAAIICDSSSYAARNMISTSPSQPPLQICLAVSPPPPSDIKAENEERSEKFQWVSKEIEFILLNGWLVGDPTGRVSSSAAEDQHIPLPIFPPSHCLIPLISADSLRFPISQRSARLISACDWSVVFLFPSRLFQKLANTIIWIFKFWKW